MQPLYNPALVALSVIVAIIASYTALKLAARVARAQGSLGRTWLAGGAAAMGIGIWSMHFIGVLAMTLPIPLSYNIPITIGSLLIAILTSGFAISFVGRPAITLPRFAVSGVVMGMGVTAMHYAGMAAIDITPAIRYDPPLVAASIVIAVSASCVALWLAFHLRGGASRRLALARLAASLVMGLAIAGMHYTGMAAARFARGAVCLGGMTLNNGWLAITIGLIALGLLVLTLVTAVFDAHLESRSRQHAQRLEQINADLHHRAMHDSLTGLPNRLLFMERLHAAIDQARQRLESFAVMVVDLDRFKLINDSLGHGAGDELLLQVAGRIEHALGPDDVAARIGGDEFLLIVRRLSKREVAVQRAAALIELLDRPYLVHGVELHATPSIGISLYPDDATAAAALISHADEAMYGAKQDGRNTFRFFTSGTPVFTPERLQFENDLRRALPAGQFQLHYQPLVSLGSERIVGLEALVRWAHPVNGLIPPDAFIPLAEETGLIVPLGEWVLREAVRQLHQWHARGFGALRVAVNLSATQFRQEDLVAAVGSVLEQYGVPPGCLELELTESAVMSHPQRSAHVLTALQRMGVGIAIDDFGTGYSCLSQLKRLPIRKLKIDRSFICDLGYDADDEAIVQAIVSLARTLRLAVTAEGVESADQLDLLRRLGCGEYQGYYCSRPRPAAEIEPFMRDFNAAASRRAAADGGASGMRGVVAPLALRSG